MKKLLIIIPLVILLCFDISLQQAEVVAKPALEQTKIAFSSDRDGDFEIYVMNADGSEQKRLTNSRANDWSPSWSPDGKKIAFVSDRDFTIVVTLEIYVMNADGSGQKRLTKHSAIDRCPYWSPILKTVK